MVIRTFVAAAVLCISGMLSACSSVSDLVSDSWPHFAGGEPKGLPPRPGTPGYNKFIAHGQPPQDTGAFSGNSQAAATSQTGAIASPPTTQGSSAFTEPSHQQSGAPSPPAIDGSRNDPGAVPGGLY